MALSPVLEDTADFAAMAATLDAARLPTSDLLADEARYLKWSEAGASAYGGLVLAGEEALLRSLIVAPSQRRSGVGSRAVEAIAAMGREAGATRLWLLTTDAEAFFARRGWREADRSQVPPVIGATRQFSATCPASARLMVRDL